MEEEISEKPSILTQPIFILAIVIILFNVGLFIWSMQRDSKEVEDAVDQGEGVAKEVEKVVP